MASQDWMTKDFYKVLGVPKGADAATIKKAYRKLARKYHPDQNPGNAQAEEHFKQVGEAYGVLSDPGQRKQYDAIRAMAGGGARFNAGPGGAGGGGVPFEDVFGSMFGGATARAGAGSANGRMRFSTAGGGGFEDILSGLFGASGAGGRGAGPFARQGARGADLAASTQLSFRQAVEGTTLKLALEGRQMTVRVPAGVSDGQKLRLAGKGRPGSAGAPAGDLVVTVHVADHPVFKLRAKTDLQMTLPITVEEAVAGATVQVPLLSGDSARVKIPAGTSSGTLLRLRGRGVRAAGARRAGDLLIQVRIVVPARPGRGVRSAAADFSAACGDFEPRAGLAEQVAS